MRTTFMMGLLLAACVAAGCGADSSVYMSPQRKDNGLVIILPGIEGRSGFNANIRRGIVDSGLDYAVTIYSWGRPVPLVGPLMNQMDVLGNRLAGNRLADYIEEYQNAHPGKPVWIIGHSGGGGIAIFAAEGLEAGHQVDGLILLSASISKDYPLGPALQKVRGPIVNFYNPDDGALLGLGTTITSNVDGRRGPSAGLKGFSRSYPGLREVRVTGRGDPHGAATRPSFVRNNVVPYIRRSTTAGTLAGR